MDLDTTKKICSFCGDQGRHDVPLLGGRGAFICGTCVGDFSQALAADGYERLERQPPPWESMSDVDVLAQLWQIAETGHQAEDFLGEWVRLARSRDLSWTEVAQALGISRPEAQARFA